MKRKIGALGLALSVIASCGMVTGCSGSAKADKEDGEAVTITVWQSEASQDILVQMVDEFVEKYKSEQKLDIRIGVEEEKAVSENIAESPQNAADVFAFTDDQIDSMVKDDILLPITYQAEEAIAASGGRDATVVQSAMRDGILYAYPLTASNGYFLFYDASYYTEEDVKSLDRILEIAEANNKHFAMDWTSGWYLYSFFRGAGMDVETSEDGLTNTCNWNSTDGIYKGVDVVQAMLNISKSPAFVNSPDQILKNGFEDGSVIAGVSGAWNAEFLKECLGEGYAAAKLPTYTLNGQQIQMASFEGFKLVGVNKKAENKEWAMRLAEWIANYDNQKLRYEAIGELPANVKLVEDGNIELTEAIVAEKEQAEFSNVQRIGSNYWTITSVFGTTIAAGNPDQVDLQQLLDEVVASLAVPES